MTILSTVVQVLAIIGGSAGLALLAAGGVAAALLEGHAGDTP